MRMLSRVGYRFCITLILISLSVACKQNSNNDIQEAQAPQDAKKSQNSYIKEVQAHQDANDTAGAEKLLKEAILTYPDSPYLQYRLLDLYDKSEQWDQLENYVRLYRPGPGYGINLFIDLGDLAHHYLDQRNWTQANRFFLQAGNTVDLGDDASLTPVWTDICAGAAEDFRNAGAAAGNLHDEDGIRESIRHLQHLSSNPRCFENTKLGTVGPKFIQELSSWLK